MSNDFRISDRGNNLDPSATLEISDLAKDLKEQGEEVISLAVGEPDFDTPEEIKNAAKNALDQGFTNYTSSSGIKELRKEIRKKLSQENNINTKTENIVVTPGAKFSLYLACQALLNPGDKAIIADPSWVSYKQMIKAAGANPISIPTTDKLTPKPEAIKEEMDEKVKLIFTNSPNNPTGKVWKKDELKEITEIAEKNNSIVLSDEIYEKLIYEGEHYSPASEYDNVLTVNGFSKSYSMTGWRLGYITGPEEIINTILKIQQHSVSCPTSFAQKGAIQALKKIKTKDMVKTFEERRNKALSLIEEIPGMSVEKPEGAFYLFPKYDLDIESKELALELLKEKGVAVTHGKAFGEKGENHLRISYANSIEKIEQALTKIEEYMRNKNG
ncbi:MAG: pyridoxal phosphate-dependent aminotransferase [archaeon]